MNKFISSILLVAYNLIPLIGVLEFSWNLPTILFLYWFENMVIGIVNIFKIRIAEKPIKLKLVMPQDREYSQREKNAAISIIFVIHYGLYIIGHGMFLYLFFLRGYTINTNVIFAMISLIISYSVSYFLDYIANEKYINSSSDELMKDPYVRIIILHATIIFGSFYILKFGDQNIWPLTILILFKTITELVMYLKGDDRWFSRNISFN